MTTDHRAEVEAFGRVIQAFERDSGRPAPPTMAGALVWVAMLLASALPHVAFTEITGHRAPLWLAAVQVGALLGMCAAATRSTRFAALSPALRWLFAMAAGWHLVIGWVTSTTAWNDWQHSVPWAVRAAAFQALLFVPTLLLLALGARRLDRRALRLIWGDDRTRACPGPYSAGKRPTWRRLGLIWAVIITAGTATAMLLALGPKMTDPAALVIWLPAVLLLAATNTCNEEFGFRNVPLAVLPGIVSNRQALLLTGSLFGLAHYYGNPPGASGVLLATFLGVFLAKSMVETGGSKWAYLIHWLQDVIIFSALTMAWANL